MAAIYKNRRSGKVSLPKIIGLTIVLLALLSFALTWIVAGWQRRAEAPTVEKTYSQFVEDVKKGQVVSVQMYEDLIYAESREGRYLVRSVSDSYTVDMLLKFKIPLTGIEQPSGAFSSRAQAAYLMAMLVPYFILGAVVFVMVRAVSDASESEGAYEESGSAKK
ncbi:MAG: ATP-dependent metallopeptidase FtsH/Yme1/Tma family protein [Candidatus Bruticola sp.]